MKLKNSYNKKYFKFENAFYHFAEKSRFEKLLNQFELVRLIKNVPGDIVELGVFKGNSLIRLCHFRDILKLKKKVFGFDTFSFFPENNSVNKYDKFFPQAYKKIAGNPISEKELRKILKNKKIKNVKLIKGNIYDTLSILEKKKLKISLLHLDLDTEDITKFVLSKIFKLISKKGVIILDDYKIHKGIDRAIKNFKLLNLKVCKPLFGNNPHFIIKD